MDVPVKVTDGVDVTVSVDVVETVEVLGFVLVVVTVVVAVTVLLAIVVEDPVATTKAKLLDSRTPLSTKPMLTVPGVIEEIG